MHYCATVSYSAFADGRESADEISAINLSVRFSKAELTLSVPITDTRRSWKAALRGCLNLTIIDYGLSDYIAAEYVEANKKLFRSGCNLELIRKHIWDRNKYTLFCNQGRRWKHAPTRFSMLDSFSEFNVVVETKPSCCLCKNVGYTVSTPDDSGCVRGAEKLSFGSHKAIREAQ